MREVTLYGDGLHILIDCDGRPGRDWMAFTCWYSITQVLPDAKVVVASERSGHDMLRWCPRQRVPHFFYSRNQSPFLIALGRKLIEEPVLMLGPEITVHEPLPDDLIGRISEGGPICVNNWCLPAKSEVLSPFCSIEEGCGSFQSTRWIDRGGNPLGYADRFLKGDLTVNERRVFSLWNKAASLYDNIG